MIPLCPLQFVTSGTCTLTTYVIHPKLKSTCSFVQNQKAICSNYAKFKRNGQLFRQALDEVVCDRTTPVLPLKTKLNDSFVPSGLLTHSSLIFWPEPLRSQDLT